VESQHEKLKLEKQKTIKDALATKERMDRKEK
jgi:hypothetical protein